MKTFFATLLLFTGATAFSQDSSVLIFTPHDKVQVYVGNETEPRYFRAEDFRTVTVTRDWVRQQAASDPLRQYYWRESPNSNERILAADSKTKEVSAPIYQNETHRYDTSLPSVTYQKGARVPEYDRQTGVMRFVPATYAYVQRVATSDPGRNYFFQEKRVSPSEPAEPKRYQSGEPADKYLKSSYEKYRSEGYGTKYQMPPSSVIERDAQNARNADARKNYEKLYGKPLRSLPKP